jgi:DNA repair exonuclease SbcCD ATPase subunit
MQQKSSRGVQQDDVWAAADALLAEGLRPTIERVRQKIGRGSPNTVSPMLEAWFARLGARLGVAAAAEREGGVPESVRRAMDALWTSAQASAREEAEAALGQGRAALAADQSALESARVEFSRHQAALAERDAALEQGLGLAKAQLQDQAAQVAQLQAQLRGREDELADARGSLARLVQERDAERRRHDELLRMAADESRGAVERAAANERRLLGEVDRARAEAKEARSAQAAVERREAALRAAKQQEAAALGQRAHAAEIDAASLRERLASAEERAGELERQLEEQKALMATLTQIKSGGSATRKSRSGAGQARAGQRGSAA